MNRPLADNLKVKRVLNAIRKRSEPDELTDWSSADFKNFINAMPIRSGKFRSQLHEFYSTMEEPGHAESDSYFEEDELPPFNVFMRAYYSIFRLGGDLKKRTKTHSRILQCAIYNRPKDKGFLPRESTELSWLLEQFDQRIMLQYYDYQNLYNPFCDTAVYYFLEDIVLDFDDMSDDDECYPYGWFDFFSYCDKIGIKLPTYGSDGGKYGKSIQWE